MNAISISISLVIITAIIMAAYYLQQIRDLLRSIHDTQKKLATRLGMKV